MRLQETPGPEKRLSGPDEVYDFLSVRVHESLRYNPDVENLIIILLNAHMKMIGWEVISNGTLDTLLVHPREVFKPAIVTGAYGVIIAHNHPSGDPIASDADIRVTRDLIKAGQLLRIEVADHIILGRPSPDRAKPWYSLREHGFLYS